MQTSFFDIDNWREIGATLMRNKTRTFLTAFGIFWGTLMLTLLWGGAGGLEGILSRQFSSISTTNMGAITSRSTTMPYRGFNKGRYWRLNTTDLDNIRATVDGIEYSSGVNVYWGINMNYADKTTKAPCKGIEPEVAMISVPIIHAGRFISDADMAGRRKVVAIGTRIGEALFPGLSEEEMLGKSISVNGTYFTVIGVIAQKGDASIGGGTYDETVSIPLPTMRQAFAGSSNTIDFFTFSVKPGYKVKDVAEKMRRRIMPVHTIHPADKDAIEVVDISEIFEVINGVFLGVNLLALFVGLGSLMAGIIGVGNIMWIIVRERTHEIGIRRAIGAKPSSIIVQILSESMVLTTIAGLAGIVFAVVILAVVDQATAKPEDGPPGFLISFSQAMAVLITFMILGTTAGVIPAIKAMRIKPIEAINDK